MEEVSRWLIENGLEEYCKAFKDNGWDELSLLSDMNDEDIEMCIQKRGHIVKLKRALKRTFQTFIADSNVKTRLQEASNFQEQRKKSSSSNERTEDGQLLDTASHLTKTTVLPPDDVSESLEHDTQYIAATESCGEDAGDLKRNESLKMDDNMKQLGMAIAKRLVVNEQLAEKENHRGAVQSTAVQEGSDVHMSITYIAHSDSTKVLQPTSQDMVNTEKIVTASGADNLRGIV